MKTAIFSDIHANLEALEKAAAETKSRGVVHFAVLGDTIGYGANPVECLEWVLKHAAIVLLGNHEKAIFDLQVRSWFNPLALEALVWTEHVLSDALKNKLPDLPLVFSGPTACFAHASFYDAEEFPYLWNFEEAAPSLAQLKLPVGFIGHTHIPCCFCLEKKSSEYLKPGVIHLEPHQKYLLNPGSVGQPRDRDPRLSFGIYDDEAYTFEIVRLEYENVKAAEKIRKAGLPAYLADRLL